MLTCFDSFDDGVELGFGEVAGLPFCFGGDAAGFGGFLDFDFVPELFFEVVGDGDAAVGGAFFFDHAVGPDA